MSEPGLVTQGLELMFFGMGTVFVFLTMLVFVTGFMSKLVNKYAPEEVVVPTPAKKRPQSQGVDPQLLKVLSAAVKEHRARQK
ncbi:MULTISPECIES: OadG family protein [unclassified Oceanobacter]|jgi:oxaloacetate decarboxylase gamma subunit|uniref:OadG family protein n=1 Tax=unclassified Oceanobacter TaxID=2620260 RepID=UPI0027358B8E|nr:MULTISPECIES: OadG family protein [unclassified Oceanobacter]MDP2506234.1 OadG family protein [Oceanobacter sp. 3_MG-2023]MDP2546504.1 OadG family protein [Oceanobacter sp. 4_MG-2023]MDP2609834.1 OadG family protein [Oceanobacter sp. 1_MG-2023]MDP2613164.1 OadG family protein [Oceanobacter sp. 2_MG-2023]